MICALLDEETLGRYLALCDRLGLSALVEAHDETELTIALAAGARVIGVNNRNLRDFTVDLGNSVRLRRWRRRKSSLWRRAGSNGGGHRLRCVEPRSTVC